jgi:hypothetical protein
MNHRTSCAVYDPCPGHCTCGRDEQDREKALRDKIAEWETYALQLAKQTEIWMKRAEYLANLAAGPAVNDYYWKRIDAMIVLSEVASDEQ